MQHKGEYPYLQNVAERAYIYMLLHNTLTHVCRIGLVSLPYPKQMHHRQHLPFFN
jgi:hypothetical protein